MSRTRMSSALQRYADAVVSSQCFLDKFGHRKDLPVLRHTHIQMLVHAYRGVMELGVSAIEHLPPKPHGNDVYTVDVILQLKNAKEIDFTFLTVVDGATEETVLKLERDCAEFLNKDDSKK